MTEFIQFRSLPHSAKMLSVVSYIIYIFVQFEDNSINSIAPLLVISIVRSVSVYIYCYYLMLAVSLTFYETSKFSYSGLLTMKLPTKLRNALQNHERVVIEEFLHLYICSTCLVYF